MTLLSPGLIAQELADPLTTLVWQAAEAILAIAPGALDPRLKADNSPVTAADSAADRLLSEGLARYLPGLPVISEESLESAPAPGVSFALVDPIDGTKEFLAGRDEYTVNIAVLINRRPVAGFIAVPPRGLVYRGVVGYGAERLRFDPGATAARERQQIGCRPWPDDGAIATVSRSHPDLATIACLDRLGIGRRLISGSSVKFCRIAEGAADFYPRFSPTSEWDIAAGHAILAAAGGAVVAPDGSALDYGHPESGFKVASFIAVGDLAAATTAGCFTAPAVP